MKRKICILLALLFLMTACSKGNKEGSLNIGIVQYIEHPALDKAREGFENEIKEKIDSVNIDYENAQGDISTLRTIVEKFVRDKVDLIYAIATPRVQAAKNATSDIPIIFSAVTDCVETGIVTNMEKPEGNITGCLDKVDIDKQVQIFLGIDENIKTIGTVYSQDEVNSIRQLKELKEVCKNRNLKLEEIAIQSISDLPQAVRSISKKIDGFYVFSDNKMASSIALISDILNEEKIPSVGAEEAHVEGGCLISQGISYEDLGKKSGNMAKRILIDKEDISNIGVEKGDLIDKIINMETLEKLNLDKNLDIFKNSIIIND